MKDVSIKLLFLCLTFDYVTSMVPQPIQTKLDPQIYELFSMIPDGTKIGFWSTEQVNDQAEAVISMLIDKKYSLTIIVGENFKSTSQFECFIVVGLEVSYHLYFFFLCIFNFYNLLEILAEKSVETTAKTN